MQEGGEAKQRTAGNVIGDQLCGNAMILLDGLLLPAILSPRDLFRKGVGEVKGTGNQTEKTWKRGGKYWMPLSN